MRLSGDSPRFLIKVIFAREKLGACRCIQTIGLRRSTVSRVEQDRMLVRANG